MPNPKKEELSDIFETVRQEQQRSAPSNINPEKADRQEMVQLNLTVPVEFRQRLKVYAVQHRTTLVKVVMQACEEWMHNAEV